MIRIIITYYLYITYLFITILRNDFNCSHAATFDNKIMSLKCGLKGSVQW